MQAKPRSAAGSSDLPCNRSAQEPCWPQEPSAASTPAWASPPRHIPDNGRRRARLIAAMSLPYGAVGCKWRGRDAAVHATGGARCPNINLRLCGFSSVSARPGRALRHPWQKDRQRSQKRCGHARQRKLSRSLMMLACASTAVSSGPDNVGRCNVRPAVRASSFSKVCECPGRTLTCRQFRCQREPAWCVRSAGDGTERRGSAAPRCVRWSLCQFCKQPGVGSDPVVEAPLLELLVRAVHLVVIQAEADQQAVDAQHAMQRIDDGN